MNTFQEDLFFQVLRFAKVTFLVPRYFEWNKIRPKARIPKPEIRTGRRTGVSPVCRATTEGERHDAFTCSGRNWSATLWRAADPDRRDAYPTTGSDFGLRASFASGFDLRVSLMPSDPIQTWL